MIIGDKKELRKYYREIKRNLNCSLKDKKRFMNDIKETINVYLYDNPNTNIDDIYNIYGSPTELKESFLINFDYKDINTRISVSKVIKRSIIFAFLLIIIFYVYLLVDRTINKPTIVTIEADIFKNQTNGGSYGEN